jgi:hypothetical protein
LHGSGFEDRKLSNLHVITTQLDELRELEEDGGVALGDNEAFERGKECVYRGEEEGEGEGVEVDLMLEEEDKLREVR